MLETVVEPTVTARSRLLEGLSASIKARGYRDTKIADIVAHARTSRRTFYEVFDSKDDCFLALVQEMSQLMQAHIARSVNPDDTWEEQVRAGVTAWIEAMGSQPELSVSWIRELPLLGPAAARAQQDALRSFKAMLIGMTNTQKMRAAGVPPLSDAKATILLGGLRELAAGVFEVGDGIDSVTEPAVEAALALIGPAPELDRRRRRKSSD